MPFPALTPLIAGLVGRLGGSAALGTIGRQLGGRAAAGAATQAATSTAAPAGGGLWQAALRALGVGRQAATASAPRAAAPAAGQASGQAAGGLRGMLAGISRQLAGQAAATQAAKGATGAATPPRVKVDLNDKGLFKKAFTSSGVQSPTTIAEEQQREQQREEDEQKQSEARAALFRNLTRAVTGSVVAMVGMPIALKKFATSLIDAQRNLARYSAAHALAQLKLERGRLQRDIRRAQGTEGTASMLADAVNGLEQELAPLKTGLANLTNIAGTMAAYSARGTVFLAKVVSGFHVLEQIYQTMQNIPWLKKWFPKPQPMPAEQLLAAIADGAFDRRRQAPPPRRPRAKP
ncbi:MAG: hypothetical protein AB7U73_01330 [Pirellulales bacterium]